MRNDDGHGGFNVGGDGTPSSTRLVPPAKLTIDDVRKADSPAGSGMEVALRVHGRMEFLLTISVDEHEWIRSRLKRACLEQFPGLDDYYCEQTVGTDELPDLERALDSIATVHPGASHMLGALRAVVSEAVATDADVLFVPV